MSHVILLGGPYHGQKAVEVGDTDGQIAMASPEGDELYVIQKRIGPIAYYPHHSASLSDLPRLMADSLAR